MALIFPDTRGNQPSTHALIIGVGGYRHLEGGSDEREQVVEHVGLLKQLTSPLHSAVAFAQHLLDSRNALRSPLGSIDLLISPESEDSNSIPAHMNAARPATIANVREAYAAWRERCNRNEDNITIFYFCGHGLEKENQILLTEDFGADPLNPWLGAFDFDSTRLAFHGCKAKTQCFFIDACRKITSAMMKSRPNALALENGFYDIPDCEVDLTMKAAAHNEIAMSPKRSVSYFTQALISALQGSVASQGSTGWCVETGQIAAHITDVLAFLSPSQGYVQRCPCDVVGNAVLFSIVGRPKVLLNLVCDSTEANQAVELTFLQPGDSSDEALYHKGAPWSLSVDAGYYIAEAYFSGGEFSNTRRDVIAIPPPNRKYLIECKQI